MPSYGFGFRASTRRGGGEGRLYLRVSHEGESRSLTTGYRIFPDEWDAGRRRLRIPFDRSARSRELVEMESAMLCDLRRMDVAISGLEREGDFTVDELMERYRSSLTGSSFFAFAERLASELESKNHQRTAGAYRTAAARLRAFNGGNDICPQHFTSRFIGDFQRMLKSEGCSMNTVSFYMRTLRAIYNKAVVGMHSHRLGENPFSGVYTGVSTTRKLALTSGDLAALSALDPTVSGRRGDVEPLPDNLGQSLAMFLFCYHARGMCFVDMANLKKSDLRGDTIRYRRRKTGQAIELRVLPAMRRIIDWFGSFTSGSRYLFPVISDPHKNHRLQYESGLRLQNQRLKRVAMLCGVGKLISTHCARHSWATVAKSAGLPLAVISEGLGHTNQRTTEIYLASLARSIIDHASRVVSEAIKPGEKTMKIKKRDRLFLGGGVGLPSGYGMFGGGYGYAVGYR